MATGHRLNRLLGMKFASDTELKKAVELVLGFRVSNQDFERAKPSWNAGADGYGGLALKETVEYFGYRITGRGRKKRLQRITQSERLTILLKEFGTRLSKLSTDKYYKKHGRPSPYTKLFGIMEPVPIDELREKLLELGAKEEKRSGVPLPYPKRIIRLDSSFDLWEIGYVYIEPDTSSMLFVLYGVTMIEAAELGFHPAHVLAHLMCDIVPQEVSQMVIPLPFIIKDGQRLSIVVPSPEISSQVVSSVYSKTRNAIIRETREVTGNWTRPRRLSSRTTHLIDFVRNTPNLSWGERLEKWKEQYPSHEPYKNKNVMAVVYSRAKRKTMV